MMESLKRAMRAISREIEHKLKHGNSWKPGERRAQRRTMARAWAKNRWKAMVAA